MLKKLAIALALTALASTLPTVQAQVTCSADVPQDICKSADGFFQTTTQHDPVRIEVLTPAEFRHRRDIYAKEVERIDENCDCFNLLRPRLMSNTFSEEMMLLRDKPGGTHVSEVLISFEAFYAFDSSKTTVTDRVVHMVHSGVVDWSQMNAIATYVEGYTDALRNTP